jgi:heme exporter protein A
MLEAVGLECVRGGRLLFSDIHFALAPGEIRQIHGPNGAGKTSLLRILCGLSLPEAGQVLWQGQPIAKTRASYQANLAYVGHALGLKLDLTARENLSFALSLHPSRLDADPNEALARAGLANATNLLCRHLSAGQRRRVAIARLYLTAAKLWILDEPLSAIDAEGVAEIERLLRNHLDENGMVLLTSHQPIAVAGRTIEGVSLQ